MKTFLVVTAVIVFFAGPLSQGKDRAQYRLRETAAISTDILCLSDLLPEGTPQAIQQASQGISFGRTPNAGSTRVLTAAEIRRRLAKNPALQWELSIPSSVAITRLRKGISGEVLNRTVEEFLRSAGWPESQLPVEFTLHGETAPAEASLQVVQVSWDDRQSAVNFHLRCRAQKQCANFLVQAPASARQAIDWQEQLKHTSASGVNYAAGISTYTHLHAPLLAKAGETALLSMQSDGVRISVRVVCLQRGTLGQVIRACDLQSHKVYRAEVVSQGVLRAIVD
jgi:phosphatidylserine/phosphatidylglycerophosphate/cardiolipin synthase-like enzyme